MILLPHMLLINAALQKKNENVQPLMERTNLIQRRGLEEPDHALVPLSFFHSFLILYHFDYSDF